VCDCAVAADGQSWRMTTPPAEQLEDGALPLTAEAAKLAEVQKLVALRGGDRKILARACRGIGWCAAGCENEAANGSAR
jgi:ferredoxin